MNNHKSLPGIFAIVLTLAFVGSRQTFADDDTATIIASYKAFLPKFIATFEKDESASMHKGPARNVRYDLKKTDSVLYPLQGVLVFSSADTPEELNGGDYKKYSFTFSFSDGKWTVSSGSKFIHPKEDDITPRTEDITDLAESVAESAQKD